MRDNSLQISVCLVTCPNLESSKTLARHLINSELAACVNIIEGATSIYFWDGAVQEDRECILIIKSPADKITALKAEVLKSHSYDNPEFLVLNCDAGAENYLNWVIETCHRTSLK